jgi:hypothetical protein
MDSQTVNHDLCFGGGGASISEKLCKIEMYPYTLSVSQYDIM